jgi:RecB family endonuclease NucS
MDETKKTKSPEAQERGDAARKLATSRGLNWKTLSKDERKALKKEAGPTSKE